MGDRREAGLKAPIGHDAMRGDSALLRESPSSMAYWDNVFGVRWREGIQLLFAKHFHWDDVLEFFSEPQTHRYIVNGEEQTSDMFYLGEQFVGPGKKNKLHIAAALPGAISTRHIHAHSGGMEMYFLASGEMIMVKGDDNNLEVEQLPIKKFKSVPENTWHQVRVLEQPSLVLVTNYEASKVERSKLHRLHPNQLRTWVTLEEKVLYSRAA